ncbi:NAD(P)/FAD-dependent oxidoreductase [Methanocella sp. CWC-04]|uniref:NAD(P)/FAD-dependent oxidoreductase n=1 Tax=Methanooceanicella nereidis TaxID=2052831 RepID=A0AAP2R9T1_9EURY|nr:NAD(P)/FAD-dependent oxidoreductase [Methanocella sp. CWC-04]
MRGTLITRKSVIIIGGGIAGLSAGCYARMNGYDTHIFEMHNIPGGLCTSWKRKGYVFDGCLHWLVGTTGGPKFYDMWRELGAIQNRRIIYDEDFMQIVGKGGKRFIVYNNIDRLEKHMKELSPADSKTINELIAALKKFKRMEIPTLKPGELYTKMDILKMIISMWPVMGAMNKYSKMTHMQFSEKFTDPFLREAFNDIFDFPGFPFTAFLITQAWFDNGWQGFPEGGSLEFSKAIEKRYKDLGGKVSYRSKVRNIIVENGAAVGVRMEDGTEHRADVVISACDGHETLYDMLEGKYLTEKLKTFYDSYPLFPSGMQVSLGIARDFSDEPHSQVFKLDGTVNITGVPVDKLLFKHYCKDPTIAPKGKSVVASFITADHAYWKKLGGDRAKYEAEKENVAELVISELEKHYPGVRQQIEAIDVASPTTYERYTGNWQGSYMGWMNSGQRKILGSRLPGLKNFYMCGMWTMVGGGVPTAAMTARGAVEIMCKEDGKKFLTTHG